MDYVWICSQCSKLKPVWKYKGQSWCASCIKERRHQRKVVQRKRVVHSSTGEQTPKKHFTKKSGHNWNKLVTPTGFGDFIGQETAKRELKTMLDASKIHGIPVQHCLFSGSFGLGKTTLAVIFAKEVAKNKEEWDIITAVSVKNEYHFPKEKVVVVDEIHTIRKEEWLLGIMDRGEQIILGATTTAGSLSGPLRSRFVSLVLKPYTVEELKVMVHGAAASLGYECPDYIAQEVAQRGKTVARTALFLFKRVYDRVVLSNFVNEDILGTWFKDMDIDPDGLDNADRAYLHCLSDKPVGIQNLSAMTGLDTTTLQETIEPYLLTRGFIQRTPRGRMLGDRKPKEIWD